jgi:hypothetical protein
MSRLLTPAEIAALEAVAERVALKAADRIAERILEALRTAAPATGIKPASPEVFCPNRKRLAEVTGFSPWMLRAIWRATRGTDDCPFAPSGRGAYPSKILAWHQRHPDFCAHFIKTQPAVASPADHMRAAQGRFVARRRRQPGSL